MRMRVKQLNDGTTEVDVLLLPDGRACIHWLRECEGGKVTVVKHPQLTAAPWYKDGAKSGKFSVACRPEQDTVSSVKRGNTRYMCLTSGDIDAVTCPACLATRQQGD